MLRTDARRVVDPGEFPGDNRHWMGFHVDHDNAQLEETSLRWWRCDPQRVLDNELFVVTVGTFPVAVYRVTGLQDSVTRADEDAERHHYAGTLLARVTAGMVVCPRRPVPGCLQAATTQIMSSRIAVDSGGPVGYLMPR